MAPFASKIVDGALNEAPLCRSGSWLTMPPPLPPPTTFERIVRARLSFKLFGRFLGTGHLAHTAVVADAPSTDDEESSDSDEDGV